MARCPVCGHDVQTPFFLNLNDWAQLACPACKARLEMKPPRSALLAPIMGPLFVLARRGRIFEVVAFAFMFSTIFLLLIESMRPSCDSATNRFRNLPFGWISTALRTYGLKCLTTTAEA